MAYKKDQESQHPYVLRYHMYYAHNGHLDHSSRSTGQLLFNLAMVRLSVHGLDAQELCTVECEQGATGRQLKEAIEEATAWQELVCTQNLAIGTEVLSDNEVLSHLVDGTEVTLTRRPAPEKLLVTPTTGEQRKSLALALRHFENSAVLVEVPMHGYVFGLPCQEDSVKALYKDIANGVEEDEVHFKPLDPSSWRSCLPWDQMGIPFQEILAVLSLQSHCMLIGDGLSMAFGCVLLLDGSLVAFATFLDEADNYVNYGTSCVCASASADTCEELWSKYRGFMNCLASPLSEAWKVPREGKATDPMPPVKVRVMQDIMWGMDGENLQERGWPGRFDPARQGLHLPATPYTPKMPLWLKEAFRELTPSCDAFRRACDQVQQSCGPEEAKGGGRGRGKGKGKGYSSGPCRRSFGEAWAMLREKLHGQDPGRMELLEPVLTALAGAEPPDSISYDISELSRKHMANLETDVVFGPGQTWIDCSSPPRSTRGT